MTRAAMGVAVSFAALLTSAGVASASPTSHVKFAGGGEYCALLTSYNSKQSAADHALETPGEAEAAIKSAYADLQKDESIILGVAPSVLQSPYKTIFKGLNTFYSDLSSDGYDFLKLTTAQEEQFESLGKTMDAAANTIDAYNKKVCGVKS